MNIKELEKRVVELDSQMQEIVKETKNLKLKKYRRLECAVAQYEYIHYILFDENFLKNV